MMAIFSESVDDAIWAGIEKLNAVKQLNLEQIENQKQPLRIGIGLNHGHMMVGLVGEKNRMQGDAFSDNVNLAARIESLCKYYEVSFLISESVYSNISEKSNFHIRFIDKVKVIGKSEPVAIYEVVV
jgi:adenylate cyclase